MKTVSTNNDCFLWPSINHFFSVVKFDKCLLFWHVCLKNLTFGNIGWPAQAIFSFYTNKVVPALQFHFTILFHLSKQKRLVQVIPSFWMLDFYSNKLHPLSKVRIKSWIVINFIITFSRLIRWCMGETL